jgi:hypothetical protein
VNARTLICAFVAVVSLTTVACVEEPETPYDARGDVYGVPSRLDAQEPAPQPIDDTPEPLWPRLFTSGDAVFATYEPQVDSWKSDKLEAHAAVEVYPAGATTPSYGVVSFEAPTQTDRERGVVTLGDVRVVRANFPTAKDREAVYLEALRGADLAEAKTLTIDRMERRVAYGASRGAVPSQPVKNDPPAIVVSDRPALLVLIDGAPRFADEAGVRRVINTRALLVSDRGSFYLWVGDRWLRARAVEGPYAEARDVPAALEQARGRLSTAQAVDLYGDETERMRQGLRVIVATKPTELIETAGAPIYARIEGTTLSWVRNTDADVLRDDATGETYVLLSGRWFRAPSLSGPWTYVPRRELPRTFANIPRAHREARVLSSVPGTPEAEEAAIAATIPTMATVDRSRGRLAVLYDGAPDFQPIEGTSAPLTYAVNSATPVIATSDGMYYAVENGVWFVATSPNGPWTVATSVPGAIYSIPVSSPLHYVTYVRVYGYSPGYAYVGYTPGYLGAVYTDGVVVFGTGFVYRPWIGHAWYGRPRYWSPSWRWHGPTVFAGTNIYRRWAPSVVHAPPARVLAAPRVSAPPARARASPWIGPRPAPPSIAPRVRAPASPSFAPRPAPPSIAPRVRAPASPSFAPRPAPPSIAPRVRAPASPSFAPRPAPPSIARPGSGVIRQNPAGAARVVPPRSAPPRTGAPRRR